MLARKIEIEQGLEEVPPLSAHLLALGNERGRFTVRDAVAATGANRNTIKLHLRRLVEQGRLRRAGRGRGSWYVLA